MINNILKLKSCGLVTAPCKAECFIPAQYGLAHIASYGLCLTYLNCEVRKDSAQHHHSLLTVNLLSRLDLTNCLSQVHSNTSRLLHPHHESRVVSLKEWNPVPHGTLIFGFRRAFDASPRMRRSWTRRGSSSCVTRPRWVSWQPR